MSQVIKISKSGVDVLGTTNTPNDYIFDSSLNTFKIVASGTAVGTVTSSPGTVTIAHNQGTTPAVFGFCKFPDGAVALPNEADYSATDTYGRYWRLEVDGTNMYFIFFSGGTSYNGTVSYYVFEAPLT